MNHRKIILCGMMGSGKSTVGRLMACYLDWDFVDIDELIVKTAGKLISTIFEEDGAERFREMESRLLAEAMEKHPHSVIAPGGGAVVLSENYEVMQKGGVLVLLKASSETLAERLKDVDDRPLLLKGDGVKTRIDEILARREWIYEQIPVQ
ncbi:MAG: shikimate kinase, partial [bacterium]